MRTLYFIILSLGFLVAHAQNQSNFDSEYSDDRANILKINGLALRYGSIAIAYEKALRHRNSVKLEVKYIGLIEQDDYDHYEGVGINIGYKIKYAGIFLKKTINQMSHIFHGGYFQPNIGFNFFNRELSANRFSQHRLINIGIDCGRQWVIKNRIALDFFIGFHWVDGSNTRRISEYSIGDLFIDSPQGIRYGIQIGYLFGKYGNELKLKNIKKLRQLKKSKSAIGE